MVSRGGSGVLAVVREVQIPLLAVLLIGGCAAKARRALGARSIEAGIGPTGMFPFRLQRPAAIATCLSEFGPPNRIVFAYSADASLRPTVDKLQNV